MARKWIEITNEANEALIRRGTSQYAEKHRTASGWRIPLEPETLELLEKRRFEGESFSDVIVRILTKPS